MRYFLGILLLFGGAIAAYLAVDTVLWQDRAVRTFVPTDAFVLSSQLDIHHGKSTSYAPAVTYVYTFRGQRYQSSRVLPFSESGSSDWARSILRRFPADAHVTAYVNDAAPQESVLVQVYSPTPYFFSFAALAAAAAGFGLLTGILTSGRSTMSAVPLGADGWQLLLPNKTIHRRRRDFALLLLVSAVPAALLLGHYLRVVRPLGAGGLVLALLTALLLVIELSLFVRAYLLSRHISDARLQVNPAPMTRGQPLQLRAELDAYAPLRVTSFRACVACVEHYKERQGTKTVYGTRVHNEKTAHLAADSSVAAGQILAGEGAVCFDADSVPRSRDPAAPKVYPYYSWEVRLNLALAGSPDYHAVFPLTTF